MNNIDSLLLVTGIDISYKDQMILLYITVLHIVSYLKTTFNIRIIN